MSVCNSIWPRWDAASRHARGHQGFRETGSAFEATSREVVAGHPVSVAQSYVWLGNQTNRQWFAIRMHLHPHRHFGIDPYTEGTDIGPQSPTRAPRDNA